LHVAFAIAKDELEGWEAHLASRGVTIEGRNDWERGGRSIIFATRIRTCNAGIVVGVLGGAGSKPTPLEALP
jgi:hypothetical protein